MACRRSAPTPWLTVVDSHVPATPSNAAATATTMSSTSDGAIRPKLTRP